MIKNIINVSEQINFTKILREICRSNPASVGGKGEKWFTGMPLPFESAEIHRENCVFNVSVAKEPSRYTNYGYSGVYGTEITIKTHHCVNGAICIKTIPNESMSYHEKHGLKIDDNCVLVEFDGRQDVATKATDETWEYIYDIVATVFETFVYIANINAIPADETKEVQAKTKNKKGKKKQKSIKYITTKKYVLTGLEKRTRGKAIYTTPEWGVRGFYRTLKNGKRIWIKPQTRKRKGVIKDAREQRESIYKIT